MFCSALPFTDLYSGLHCGMGISHIGNENVGEKEQDYERKDHKNTLINPVITIHLVWKVSKHEHLVVHRQHDRILELSLEAKHHIVLEVVKVIYADYRDPDKHKTGQNTAQRSLDNFAENSHGLP